MRRYEFYSQPSDLLSRILIVTKKGVSLVATPLAWATASLFLGFFVGLAAVILPPTAVFGIVALAAIALYWAMPDLPYIPLVAARRVFFAMIVVNFCVPAYYALSLPGLPWVSARRMAVFLFVVLFAVVTGGSSGERKYIFDVISKNRLAMICVCGFLFMAVLSIFTSVNPPASLSALVDGILLWYIPLIAVLFFVRTQGQIALLLRILCCCCLFVTLGGIASFIVHKNVFIMILPSWVLDAILQNTPTFERMLTGTVDDRNGFYRSESIFSVSLSFAEYEAIMLCIGYYLASGANGLRDRIIGILTIIFVGVGIFASGSRGGYMSAIVGTVAFGFIAIVRTLRFGGRSLVPGIAAVGSIMAFALMAVAVFAVPAVHKRVIGGGAEAYSDQARYEQWQLGVPQIESNPVTGHGFAMGGLVVGYHANTERPTIDSYVLSVLVELGVPGFMFFIGIVGMGLFTGAKIALSVRSPEGLLGAALAGAVAAFGFYRIALSQVENFTLFFVLVALTMSLNAQFRRAGGEKPQQIAV